MLTPNTGSVKKVQFYAVLALALCSMSAGAAELAIPMDKVQQQLAEKAEQSFSRKLEECREKERKEGHNAPRYPVRIAEQESPVKGVPGVFAGAQWTAP